MGSCLSKDTSTADGVQYKPSADGNDSEAVLTQGGGGSQPRYTQDPVRSRNNEPAEPEDSNQKGISHHAIQVALAQGITSVFHILKRVSLVVCLFLARRFFENV